MTGAIHPLLLSRHVMTCKHTAFTLLLPKNIGFFEVLPKAQYLQLSRRIPPIDLYVYKHKCTWLYQTFFYFST